MAATCSKRSHSDMIGAVDHSHPVAVGQRCDRSLDHEVFQTLFAMIMTLLIAMEFKHSISLAWSTGCCVSAMIASLAARIEPFVLCLLARERPGGAPVT